MAELDCGRDQQCGYDYSQQIRLTFDADVLRNVGVASGDELRINANHPAMAGDPVPSSPSVGRGILRHNHLRRNY